MNDAEEQHDEQDLHKQGWHEGARAWFWSDLRAELREYTGGAPRYSGQLYAVADDFESYVEQQSSSLGLGAVPLGAVTYARAALRAASYRVDEGTLYFQGPEGLPDSFLRRAEEWAEARVHAAVRATRPGDALDLFDQQ